MRQASSAVEIEDLAAATATQSRRIRVYPNKALGDAPALREAAQEYIGNCATGIVSVS